MSVLKLSFLGPCILEKDGAPIQVSRRKALALLAYLAVTHQSYPRDVLTDLLWPDAEPTRGRTSLRRVLSDLSSEIGEGVLDVWGNNVSIHWSPELWVDLDEFHTCLHSIQEHNHPDTPLCAACASYARRAAALYRNDLLTGFNLPDSPVFDDWQYFEGETIRKDFAVALEKLVGYHTQSHEYAEALRYARRWSSLDPLVEAPHIALMNLYTLTGQRIQALRQYQDYAHLLNAELKSTPGEEITALFHSLDQAHNLAPAPNQVISQLETTTPQTNLPTQITPFIGREGELEKIRGLLVDPDCRLVTLIGPGGVGKSRLAVQAASKCAGDFADGVFFIPLEAVTTRESLVRSVANAFRLPFFSMDDLKIQLLSFLRKKKHLLVLDNFDHLQTESAFILEVLNAAPNVKILATSQSRLNLDGEYALVVTGLDYPDIEKQRQLTNPADWQRYSAICLFLQSARRALPGFEPQVGDWHEIARICAMMDGLPLGVILAAGWIEVLSPKEIANELTHSLSILETNLENIPERHRNIRLVFNTSLKLLEEREIWPFLKLAIFRGGFTRPAAQEITGLSLPSLKILVSRSLLRPDIHFGRYYLHPLLRQYALSKLEMAGEMDTISQVHCLYFSEFLRSRDIEIRGRRMLQILNEIEADFDNIRTAWLWAAEHRRFDLIDPMIEGIFIFCVQRNLWDEAFSIFQQTRDLLAPKPGEEPHPVWGRLLSYFYGENEGQARTQVGLSLEIARKHHDPAAEAHALAEAGWLAIKANQFSDAKENFEQSLMYYRANHEIYSIIILLRSIALCALSLGDWECATQSGRESLSISREINDRLRIAECLNTTGSIAFFMGAYSEARTNFQQSVNLQKGLGNWSDLVLNYLMAGWLSYLRGEIDECRRMAEEGMNLAAGSDMLEARAIAKIELGLVALHQDGPEAAAHLLDESQSILFDPQLKPWTSAMNPCISVLIHWGLAVLAAGTGNRHLASQQMNHLLHSQYVRVSGPSRTWGLPVIAWLRWQEGDAGQAVFLLALAHSAPGAITGWLEHCTWIERFKSDLLAELGEYEYHRAWKESQRQTVDMTYIPEEKNIKTSQAGGGSVSIAKPA